MESSLTGARRADYADKDTGKEYEKDVSFRRGESLRESLTKAWRRRGRSERPINVNNGKTRYTFRLLNRTPVYNCVVLAEICLGNTVFVGGWTICHGRQIASM